MILRRIAILILFTFSLASAADTTLRFKHGNEASLPVLQQGEPAFTLDTNRLFVGGASGNKKVGAEACVDVFDGADSTVPGPPGPPTNITIGTVTTVDSTIPAAATMTGSSPSQVLNLVIPQGPPGQNAAVTQPAVLGALATPGGDPISRQPLAPQTDTTPMYDVHDQTPGHVRWYLTGNGTMGFQDVNGIAYVMVNTTTQAIEGRDTSNRLRLAIARQGTITTYHTDGTTPAFRIYSTGLSSDALPSQTGQTGFLKTDGTNATWQPVSGSGSPGGANKTIQYNDNGVFAGFGRYSAGCLIL